MKLPSRHLRSTQFPVLEGIHPDAPIPATYRMCLSLCHVKEFLFPIVRGVNTSQMPLADKIGGGGDDVGISRRDKGRSVLHKDANNSKRIQLYLQPRKHWKKFGTVSSRQV